MKKKKFKKFLKRLDEVLRANVNREETANQLELDTILGGEKIKANDRDLDETEPKLSFSQLEEMILKSTAKSEYKQASIVILRGIFAEQKLKE